MIGRTSLVALGFSALAGGAALALGASGNSTVADPGGWNTPTCSAVPMAAREATPQTPTDELWAIPPGGTCVLAIVGGTTKILELRYADGGLWARWNFEPIEQGRRFYFRDGTQLALVPASNGASLPSAGIWHAGRQQVLMQPGRTVACSGKDSSKAVRVRSGQGLEVRVPGERIASAWADHTFAGGPVVRLSRRSRSRWTWTVPANLVSPRRLELVVRFASGEAAVYGTCLRIAAPPESIDG